MLVHFTRQLVMGVVWGGPTLRVCVFITAFVIVFQWPLTEMVTSLTNAQPWKRKECLVICLVHNSITETFDSVYLEWLVDVLKMFE